MNRVDGSRQTHSTFECFGNRRECNATLAELCATKGRFSVERYSMKRPTERERTERDGECAMEIYIDN